MPGYFDNAEGSIKYPGNPPKLYWLFGNVTDDLLDMR